MTIEHDEMPRVAKVIDTMKVVINCGSNVGVQLGQKFLIFAVGDEVFDPITKESLGRLEIVRGRGKVTYVQDMMSTVDSIEEYRFPAKTRKIRQPLQFLGNTVEEIEPGRTEELPFEGVEVGDYAKPI